MLRIRERDPGEECESVNVRRDFWVCFCFEGKSERAGDLSELYSTRNRVVFAPSSSMFDARMSNPRVLAARAEPMAAAEGGVEGRRRCAAAALVEEVSIRSVEGWCVVR